MVHEAMVHRILLEKMGVENYSPKFLKVVQPAGLNKETNQKGKRLLHGPPNVLNFWATPPQLRNPLYCANE